MTTFYLQCFAAVSRHLSFTKAAEELFTNQSAISRAIAALESEIGCTLIDRNTRTVRLTHAGKTFLGQCSELLHLSQEAVLVTKAAHYGKFGTLKLGIIKQHFDRNLTGMLCRFVRLYPDINIKFVPLEYAQLIPNLKSGEIDAVICAPVDDSEKGICSITVQRGRADFLIIQASHPLAKAEAVRAEDVKELDFVAFTDANRRVPFDQLNKFAAENNFTPNIVAHTTDSGELNMLVALGRGVAVVTSPPEFMWMYKDDEYIRYVPINNSAEFVDELHWLADNDNPALMNFLEVAKAHLSRTLFS